MEHPSVGKYLRYGGLVEFSLTPGLYRTSAPIGQHTKPLLREIGYNDQHIEDLGRRGIVQWADPRWVGSRSEDVQHAGSRSDLATLS